MPSQRARHLRNNLTDAERCLWTRLRYRQVSGFKFRRQIPIGPFIVDFACLDRRLVVEVDGGQHAAAEQADRERTAWLEARGYRVLRFWNHDVLRTTDAVVAAIDDELRTRALGSAEPSPPP